MPVELVPSPADARAQAAALAALARARIVVEPSPAAYASPWRLAAALEAVEHAPGVERGAVRIAGYAPSPRSTRGATRA